MSGLGASVDQVRRQFATLREVFEKCRAFFPEMSAFRELSMGMSDDFLVAIEEGATIVRIGSSLYPRS